MSSSTPSPRFLLDENVKSVLAKFLQESGQDVKLSPKGANDSSLAKICKEENRILITNDYDFIHYSKDKLFCLLLLRLPQNDTNMLVKRIKEFLESELKLESKLVIIGKDGSKVFELGETIELE